MNWITHKWTVKIFFFNFRIKNFEQMILLGFVKKKNNKQKLTNKRNKNKKNDSRQKIAPLTLRFVNFEEKKRK